MPEKRLAPIFEKIPASTPVVIPPKQEEVYSQWYLTALQVRHTGPNAYDLEAFWTLGNETGLSDKTINNIVRNVISPESLEAQLGKAFLDANPDVVNLMPALLATLAKVAHQQGIL